MSTPRQRRLAGSFLAAASFFALAASGVQAAQVNFVTGATGNAINVFKEIFKIWEAQTGNTVNIVPMPSSTTDQFAQYRLWLAAQNPDIDVYMVDVIWAPQLADNFVDLSEAAKDLAPTHFPSIIESQTVDGRLVALPIFTDAPALYYRKDLLEKNGVEVPKTWDELTAAAQKVMDAERAAGSKDLWGYVWQGAAYEGLTCNALEWVKSNGGGQIIQPDGTISIYNDSAEKALDMARGWVGTISPPGVLSYMEEEARGVWQTGNAVFMRNWPYAYALGNGADSAVKDKFDVAPLPSGGGDTTSAATLGGWNAAVSKFSPNQEEAVSLAMFMASPEFQKQHALMAANLPTIVALYDDPEIAEKQPIIPRWKEIFLNAVPRPSAPTKVAYNEVSSKFWTAVHQTLSGDGTAGENLELLEVDLDELKGAGW